MKGLLIFSYFIVCAAIIFVVPGIVAPYEPYSTLDAGQALALCLGIAAIVGYLIYRNREQGSFLLQLFAWGLLVRLIVASGIFAFHAQDFFGGDAITYDFFGFAQMRAWEGDAYFKVLSDRFEAGQASAWGMVKMVAVVYSLIGRNTLAIQFVNSIIGAATRT